MKTTIDIPDQDLEEVIRLTGANTKREAVVYAIRDFNKRRRMSLLAEMLGSFEDFMTRDDLRKLRDDQ